MLRRYRLLIIRSSFVLVFTGVLARIWYVQTVDTFITHRARQEWSAKTVLPAVRGTIYDAGGNVLATDVPAYDIDINAGAIQKAGQATLIKAADGIARIVGASPQVIASRLAARGLAWLRMYPYMVHVTLQHEQQLVALFNQLGLSSDINPHKTYRRIYPNGSFASEVLGFTGYGGSGSAGLELYYNRYLSGVPGYKTFTRDVVGAPVPFRPVTVHPPKNGDNLYLTINPAIQMAAEHALATIKKRFTPARAAVIVSNPRTGGILAMSTLPDYNPNRYWNYPSSTLYTNWAISDPFEPGSTFKPYTITGALATHAIRLNQRYMSGVVNVNGVAIHDWNLYGWGPLTYAQAMIYSSNVGFVHIGQAEGVKTFYHYISQYGFTKPTGIDLPGEGNSIIFPQKHLNKVDFATMTFGQGLAVTPIQQVAAMDAIANGGRLLTPYLVQKITTPGGRVILNQRPHVVRTIASPSIMHRITQLLVQTVNQDPQGAVGTIPGYQVAGKTGTAEIPKPGGGYYSNLYNLSFIGFAPANNPALVVFVTVSKPHHTAQWGDWVATPAARYVLQQSLNALRIPPQSSAVEAVSSTVPRTHYVTEPSLVGLTAQQAARRLAAVGLGLRPAGGAGSVVRQWPAAHTQLPGGSLVAAVTGKPNSAGQPVTVPDLRGLLSTQVWNICAWLGVTLRMHGAGYAVAQSVPPGHRIALGSTLSVTFGPSTRS